VSALDVIRIARAAGAKLTVDGSSLVLEAERPPPPQVFDMLRANKPEVLEFLRDERRVLIRHIANHFQSAPPGRCAHCGGDRRQTDQLLAIFCGTDHAELHAGCYPAWVARRESEARVALGIDPPDKEGPPRG
jgi:hypothetical protein